MNPPAVTVQWYPPQDKKVGLGGLKPLCSQKVQKATDSPPSLLQPGPWPCPQPFWTLGGLLPAGLVRGLLHGSRSTLEKRGQSWSPHAASPHAPYPHPPISQHQSAMSVNSGSETSCPSESPGNVLGYRLLALMPRASDLVNMEVFSR